MHWNGSVCWTRAVRVWDPAHAQPLSLVSSFMNMKNTTEVDDHDLDLRRPTTRTVAMPADTNPAGDIFGGWVLAQMDIAGGICAGPRAQGRVVTASIDSMSFFKPVRVGDILGVYTAITRTGRSSMDVMVEAWVRRGQIGSREKVTEATFTFVAVDDEGRAVPIPPEDQVPLYVKNNIGSL